MRRLLPDTSHAANKAATHEMREDHHKKIIQSLQVLGKANYEIIAAHCKLDRHQVGRRLCELERTLVVYKPGTTSPTKSSRQAFDYCLTEAHTLKVEHPATQLINKTAIAQQFLNELQSGQHDPKTTTVAVQANLF